MFFVFFVILDEKDDDDDAGFNDTRISNNKNMSNNQARSTKMSICFIKSNKVAHVVHRKDEEELH